METIEILPIRVRITAILRKALLAGEFAPGDELSLSETAARLGVSRTPVSGGRGIAGAADEPGRNCNRCRRKIHTGSF